MGMELKSTKQPLTRWKTKTYLTLVPETKSWGSSIGHWTNSTVASSADFWSGKVIQENLHGSVVPPRRARSCRPHSRSQLGAQLTHTHTPSLDSPSVIKRCLRTKHSLTRCTEYSPMTKHDRRLKFISFIGINVISYK